MILNRSQHCVHVRNYRDQQSADVQMSDWRGVWCLRRDAWKSDIMESGELSAMIFSTTLMLVLSATVLDSGRYCSVLILILHKETRLILQRFVMQCKCNVPTCTLTVSRAYVAIIH